MTAREPRLWVVDPSVHRAEDQGVSEVLAGWPGTARLFRPGLSAGDGPSPVLGYETDAIVLLGSAASVYDPDRWIVDLADWLRPIVTGSIHIPLLGICFGHQLVGHVAGGRVGWLRPDRSKSKGVRVTRFAASRLLPGEPELRVVVSHREELQDLPTGFYGVARRHASALDAIEHVELELFGVQFHPEARDEFARSASIDPTEIDARVIADGRRLLAAFQSRALDRWRAGSVAPDSE